MDDFASLEWDDGPFGNTDAARVNLSDFISLNGSLTDPRNDDAPMQTRIVVGRKGSGKTLYLRVLREAALQRNFITISDYNFVPTTTIIFLLRKIREYVSTVGELDDLNLYVDRRLTIISIWRTIWDRAITISAFSCALNFLRSAGKIDIRVNSISKSFSSIREIEAYILTNFEEFSVGIVSEISPQEAIVMFAESFDSSRRLHRFMSDSRWIAFDKLVDAVVSAVPSISIYIDVIDAEFDHAPEAWLICQHGLYRAIMQRAHSPASRFGRVHAVAALRDTIYAAALKSEHSSRDFQSRFIRQLDWSRPEIVHFLSSKMHKNFKIGPKTRKLDALIERWIGFSEIINGRGEPERVESYILRHSRMLPRDVVLFGNAISLEKSRRESVGRAFEHSSLRRAVSDVSRLVGTESINLCINEMMNTSIYFDEFLEESNRGPNYAEFRVFLIEKLKRFFSTVRTEIVSVEIFRQSMESSGFSEFINTVSDDASYYRLDNVLWRNGLLAYEEREAGKYKWRFNWRGAISADLVPPTASRLGFHSSLIEVFGITPSNEGPVSAA